MKKVVLDVIRPSWYDGFVCTGPSCSDNCCHTWPVETDRAHYDLYRARREPAFAALCERYLHPKDSGATDAAFAGIGEDAAGRCGFQDADGGCRIYRQVGPHALCVTCATYPRRKMCFHPGRYELSLSMSCEEAARLCVLTPEEITFRAEKLPFDENDPLLKLPITGAGPKGKAVPPPEWGDALRAACLALARERAFSIARRLTAVQLLLGQIDRLCAAGAQTQIPLAIERFLQAARGGGVEAVERQLASDRAAHLAALAVSLGHLLGGRPCDLTERLRALLGGAADAEPAGQAAQEALLSLLQKGKPLSEKAEQWLENYFVNYLFSAMFPFLYAAAGLSFERHGWLLLEQYALLRVLTVVGEQAGGGTPEEIMTKAVVHTARLAQHADLRADVTRLATAFQIRGTAHMLYLLRA